MLLLILAIIGAFCSAGGWLTMVFFIMPRMEYLDPRKPPEN